MGDRTYAYYKVHPEDIARLLELAPELHNIDPGCDYGNEPDEWGRYDAMGFDPDGAPDDGLRHIDEVNYGGGEDWQTLAAAGVRFYGWHGEGCEYPPFDFFSRDGELHEHEAGTMGGWVIYTNAGSLQEGAIDELLHFEKLRIEQHEAIDEAWSLLPCNMRRAEKC